MYERKNDKGNNLSVIAKKSEQFSAHFQINN